MRNLYQRGAAFVVVSLMLLLVVIATTTAGVFTRQNYATGSFREKMMHADYAVRAGLSTAMHQLTQNPAWSPTQASPHEEYLDPEQHVGFRVWLEGNNENGTAPLNVGGGVTLEPGQVALKAVALYNGEEISGGFGGAAQTLILMRPPVQFEYGLFQTDGALMGFGGAGGYILSYDSSAAPPLNLPYTGLPTPPPPQFQNARIRSFGDIALNGASVLGECVLPTGATVGGGTFNSLTRLDERYLPRRFEVSDGPFAGMPASGVVPPGDYAGRAFPAGTNLSFVRGGEYYIKGNLNFGDNSTVSLTGPPSAGPVIIYAHELRTGDNCSINMPSPGNPPLPREFQFYTVPDGNCDSKLIYLGTNNDIAACIAGESTTVRVLTGSRFFGGIATSSVQIGFGVEVHFDEALLGEVFNVQTEWVLVSSGLR